jgi:hypothetical protein
MLAMVAATAPAPSAVSTAEANSPRLSMYTARWAANEAVERFVRKRPDLGAVDGRVNDCRRRSPRRVDCNVSLFVVDSIDGVRSADPITCDDVVRVLLRRNGRIRYWFRAQPECY